MSSRRAFLRHRLLDALAAPALRREMFPQPVPIASVELLRNDSGFLREARALEG